MEEIDLSKNEEIQKALQEFEEKEAEEEAKYMQKEKPAPKSSALAGWIMAHSGGRLKDERQAEYVILAFVAVCFSISVFLFLTGGTPANEIITPPMPVAGEGDPNYVPLP